MAAKFDEYADRILDVILDNGGTYSQGDAGEVLANLAHDADVPYKAVSLTVLRLENMGWLQVERWDGGEARRANKVVAVTIV